MQDFVPYEKLSKKQKKAVDRRARGTWGDVNPVTKKKESARIYNRKKHRLGREDSRAGVFSLRAFDGIISIMRQMAAFVVR